MSDELAEATRICIDVAVPLPIPGTFSYSVSAPLDTQVQAGVRVRVPFKNRELIGYTVAVRAQSETEKLKPVLAVLDPEPVISTGILDLTRWIAERYGASWGETIENALPKWVKYGKKAERALAKEVEDIPHVGGVTDFQLSPDQQKAMQVIQTEMNSAQPKPVLLFGVTGSGKSEIYIRLIREVLSQGKSAICLVPEIALTEQIRRFFYKHFGGQLEVLHSKLNDTERFLAWKRLDQGERRVVLGPRSAIFAPLHNLGLIIMDEEHEGSYKQETAPRYHARDVAAWRGMHDGAVFVMGSATPSMESMRQCETGEIVRVDMRTRIDDRALPQVAIIDMKEAMQVQKRRLILSSRLVSEIEFNLQRKEGTLLLLNRRGFSTHIHCPGCGHVESCQSCQVSLTFHQESDVLLCHYCNFQKKVSDICSNCRTPVLKFAGFGTEKVESDVAARWPQARIARLDTDSIRKKGSHEVILKDFRDQKIDILIGTQMIAKGFDFPHVTLVGIVLADVGLMLPDFRSSERTFQLLTQVAGRAGRGEKPGRVFIQTFSPKHPSILFAKEHDYVNFYKNEAPQREGLGYPPFVRLINFIIRARDEKKAYLFAREWRDLLKKEWGSNESLFSEPSERSKVIVMGPSPLPFYKLRGHFRWHVMLKVPLSEKSITPQLMRWMSKIKKPSAVQMAIDVDPVNIL